MMTRKEVVTSVKSIAEELGFNISYDPDSDEFRVCPKGAGEARAYYTDDAIDVVLTMRNWYQQKD